MATMQETASAVEGLRGPTALTHGGVSGALDMRVPFRGSPGYRKMYFSFSAASNNHLEYFLARNRSD